MCREPRAWRCPATFGAVLPACPVRLQASLGKLAGKGALADDPAAILARLQHSTDMGVRAPAWATCDARSSADRAACR